jgi:hypothetical protein
MQFQLFFDYEAIVNSCSFTRKYDAVFRAFDKVYSGPNHPPFGRKGYPKSAYLKAFVYKQCEQIKYIADLIRDLESRPAICMLIGFEPGRLPDASRFSRFLSSMNNSDIETLTHSSAKLLIEAGHVSTDVLIGDSKPVRANTGENNPKNPNRCLDKKHKIKRNPAATLGYYSYIKQSSDGKKRHFAYFWGYRTHVLVSREGVVLVEVTKPNDVADKVVIKSLMRKLKRVYGQKKGRQVVLDAAYDSNDIYNFVADEMKSQAFIAENPRYKKPVDQFDEKGRPICDGGFPMKYCGTANEAGRSRIKYRCPIRGGNKREQAKLPAECPVGHPLFTNGKRYGCTAYIDLAGDARTQARLRRQSQTFRDTYSLRSEVERYFSRLGPREVEDTTLYKYRSIRNQMSIAHLSLNLVAVAAVIILRKPDRIRCYKTFADELAA